MFTPQQEALISAIAEGRSVAARAVAGSGKTTTLLAGLAKVTTPGLLLAFNKKNAEELRERLPRGSSIESKTLNALGHRVWSDHLRKRLIVSSDKTKDIIKSLNLTLETEEWTALVKMVSIAKARAISPGILNRPDPDWNEWMAGAQQIDIPDDLFEAQAKNALRVLQRSVELAWQGQIDFDDQLYMPVIFNSRFPSYPLVGVDEAQDLSPLQHEMVARLRAKQYIVVGDPNQAIYGFRGASESSYAELCAKFNLEELPLTVSFRCPEAVAVEARHYVEDFQAKPGAAPGRVSRVEQPSLAPGAIISRYNAPLIRLAFRAIRQSVPFNYLGRDFIAGLKAIHKKAPTPEAVERWLETRLREAKTKGAKNRAKDQAASLLTIHESGKDVETALAQLSAPTAAKLTLSTVHKAKGMEWNTVTFLGYNRDFLEGQEGNISYVGVTRAQDHLILQEGFV